MRAEARNLEQLELRPKQKDMEPHTRRTLVMTSPARKNKTGISISPSRLDPSLSESMTKDQGGSTSITDTQRALVKKMEQLVGEHHYRRNSGVSSLQSVGQSSGSSSNIAGNGSVQNKMSINSFTQRHQSSPLENYNPSGSARVRKEMPILAELTQKPQYERETRILQVPSKAQEIHLNLEKSEEKGNSPAISPSPRFLDLQEQASDGNLFYKRLFDRFEDKNAKRKKSPYSRTPDAILKNISSARESVASQESERKASTSPANGKLHQSSQIAIQNKSTGPDLSEEKGYYVPPTFESDLNSFLDGSFDCNNSNILKESDLQPQIQISSPTEKKSKFDKSSDRSKSALRSKLKKKLLSEPTRGRTISFKNKKRFMSPGEQRGERSPDSKIIFPGKLKTNCFADLSSSIEIQAPQPSMESIDISFDESNIQQEVPIADQVTPKDSPVKQPKRCGSAGPAQQSFNAFKSNFNKKSNKSERKTISHRKETNKIPEQGVKEKTHLEKESRIRPAKEQKQSATTSRCSTPKTKGKVRSTIFAKKRVSEGELSLSFQRKKSPVKETQEKLEKSNSMTKLFLEKMGPASDTASTCVSFRSESGVSDATVVPSSRGKPTEEKKCSTFKDMKSKKHNFKQKKKKSEKESQNIHFALFKSESNVKYGCIPVAESVISYPEKAFKNFVSSLRAREDEEEAEVVGRPPAFSTEEVTETISTEVGTNRPGSTSPDTALSPISRSLATMLAEEKKISRHQAEKRSSLTKDPETHPLEDSQMDDLQFQLMENLSKQNSFKALQEAMVKPQGQQIRSAVVVRRNKVSPLDLPFSSSLKSVKKNQEKLELTPLTPQRLDTGYSFGEDPLSGCEENFQKIERTPRLSTQDIHEGQEDSQPRKDDGNDSGPKQMKGMQDNNCAQLRKEKSPDTPSEYNLLDPLAEKDFPAARLNLSPSPAYQSESEGAPKEDKNQEIEIVAQILNRKVSDQSSSASRSKNIHNELSFGLPLFLSTLKSVASSVHNEQNMTGKVSIFTEPAKLIYLGSPLITPREEVTSMEQQCTGKEGAETDRAQIMSVVTTPKIEKLLHKKSEPESEDQGSKRKQKIQRQKSAKVQPYKASSKIDKSSRIEKDHLSSSFSGLKSKVGMSSIQAFYKLQNLAASIIQRSYRRSVVRRKTLISLKRMALTSKEIKKQREAFQFKMNQEVVICREQSTQTENKEGGVSHTEFVWRGLLLKQLTLCALMVAKGYKCIEGKVETKL